MNMGLLVNDLYISVILRRQDVGAANPAQAIF